MNFSKLQLHSKTKCIFKTTNHIYVYERTPYRWVLFNKKYVQTMIHIRKYHSPILPYLYPMGIFYQLQPGNTLLLGLGGGGLIHHLNPNFDDYHFTIVEKYQEMIDIARKFFFLPLHPNLDIKCEDANTFLHHTQKQYQHILIDLGDVHGFPTSCANVDFFQKAYQHLTDQGILALNLTHFYEIQTFKTLLNIPPLVIYADGNWILFWIKDKQGKTKLINLLQKNHYIKSYQWQAQLGDCIRLYPPFRQQLNQYIYLSYYFLKTKWLTKKSN